MCLLAFDYIIMSCNARLIADNKLVLNNVFIDISFIIMSCNARLIADKDLVLNKLFIDI